MEEGAGGDILFRVTLSVGNRVLQKYEWIEEWKSYREWHLPAALVNRRATSLVVIPPWLEELRHPWFKQPRFDPRQQPHAVPF